MHWQVCHLVCPTVILHVAQVLSYIRCLADLGHDPDRIARHLDTFFAAEYIHLVRSCSPQQSLNAAHELTMRKALHRPRGWTEHTMATPRQRHKLSTALSSFLRYLQASVPGTVPYKFCQTHNLKPADLQLEALIPVNGALLLDLPRQVESGSLAERSDSSLVHAASSEHAQSA